MKQIKNGFMDYYFVSDDYRIYNSKSKRFVTIDAKGNCYLKRTDRTIQHTSYSNILKLVFGNEFVLCDIENLPNEEWKQINNSQYFCSNLGRIKSNKSLYSKVLIPDFSNSYERVKIDIGYGLKPYLIHKIVAQLFLENPPEPFMEVHHINGNKRCNYASNLVYMSRDEHRKLHNETKRKEIKNG